ncbi:hypothetical protein HNQ07_003345 [Deinococcus metalli]|uniref:DinB family protein n=1 Tax=Deinococcus metalli TaxID=1141878 RepID=A0A7W8KGT8_9DEIO|nr:hypothetical protein [Deinococcus metalli]MBB5377845.1 hypothetical protein [Deinococcus metalli]GHF55521.1 hypothetical protein GCM10017781_34880 [Deinococcus metalli]
MTPDDLAGLLDEANHDPWESVSSALATIDGQPHPRVGWLTTHLRATKHESWTAIAAATGTPAPPDDAGLTRLMAWEVGAARALSPQALDTAVEHAGRAFTVAGLLRVNARHTAWHAGQIAALASRDRRA